MSELETKYASEVVRDLTKEKLLEKKEGLERELATTTFQLMELKEADNNIPTPITMRLSAREYQYHDDGYIGGDRLVSSVNLRVTSSYFLTAYLGAFAKGPSNGESFSVYVSELETHPADYDIANAEVIRAFDDASKQATEIIASLREKAKENNPYSDIPIRINEYKLLDALLRIEILKYCQEIDPHFSIEKIKGDDKPIA